MGTVEINNHRIQLENGGIVKTNYYKLHGREIVEKFIELLAVCDPSSENNKKRVNDLMIRIRRVIGDNIEPSELEDTSCYLGNTRLIAGFIIDLITREELPESEEERLDDLMQRILAEMNAEFGDDFIV